MNSAIYDYVKNYFRKHYVEYYLIFDDNGLKYAQNNYVNVVRDKISEKYKFADIRSGRVDNEIGNVLNDFINKYYTSMQRGDVKILYNYVYNRLIIQGEDKKYNVDMFDHMVKLVVSRVWPQYDNSRLNKDDFNKTIDLIYNNIYKTTILKINKKLDQLMDFDYEMFKYKKMGIERDAIKNYVVKEILKREEREFLIRLDSLVVNPDAELSRTGIEMKKYINQYIALVLGKDNNERDNGNGIDRKKVEDDKNNKTNLARERMKNNSVSNGDTPKKIKMNSQQKKVMKVIITLAVIGSLAVVSKSVDSYIDKRNDRDAMMRVEMLDSFDYRQTYSRNDKYYDKMADNVISVYSKLDELENENCRTLGFYNAYCGSIDVYKGDSKLRSMENLFNKVREKLTNNTNDIGLKDTIKVGISPRYFFMDFVYDTLYNAGYKEVKGEEYQNALTRYKYCNFGNQYGVVGVTLTEDENKIIDDVMKKYCEYYENLKLQLGYSIEDGNYSFFDTYTESSGRGK